MGLLLFSTKLSFVTANRNKFSSKHKEITGPYKNVSNIFKCQPIEQMHITNVIKMILMKFLP